MLFYRGYRLLTEPESFMDELRQRAYLFEDEEKPPPVNDD